MSKYAVSILAIFLGTLVVGFVTLLSSPPPSLWRVEYVNMAWEGKWSPENLLENSDYLVAIVFTPNNESIHKAGELGYIMLSGVEEFETLNISVVFIGVLGDYESYKKFLIENSRIFLGFTWLWSDRQSLMNYVSGEGNLTVILYKVEDDSPVEVRRLVDPDGDRLSKAILRVIESG